MNITLDCLPCFVRHSLEVLKEFSVEDSLREKILRKVLSRMSEIDYSLTPPEFAAEIHDYIRKQLDCDDPYEKIKKDSNLLAEKLVEKLEQNLAADSDSLRKAVMYSIAGNIIDSGVSAVTPIDEVLKSVEMAEKISPEIDDFKELETALASAEKILFLGDNAGEVFFDRILLKTLAAGKKVYYAVKSGPILNDATLVDATAAGLQHYAEIIENGTRTPGTPLNSVSKEFQQVFDAADLIISKGQANFETLSGKSDKRIFFLLRAKCEVIAQKAGVNRGSFLIFQNDKKIM
jgi:uncharacterized protein with ATP-grasp and redox domains